MLFLGNIQSVIIWAFTALLKAPTRNCFNQLSVQNPYPVPSDKEHESSFATTITGFKTNAIWQAHFIWHSFSELGPKKSVQFPSQVSPFSELYGDESVLFRLHAWWAYTQIISLDHSSTEAALETYPKKVGLIAWYNIIF